MRFASLLVSMCWLLIVFAFGCGGSLEENAALFHTGYGNDNVQLVRMAAITDNKSGIESNYRCAMVRVKDFNKNKEIFIYGEYEDGSWGRLNEASTFLKQAEPGYEMWQACAYWNTVRSGRKWAKRFVIQYAAGNTIFWDNNSGLDYVMGLHDGVMIPPASQVNVLLNEATVYKSFHGSNIFNGTIDVRNLAMQKKVKVVYTNDKWQTSRFTQATFNPIVAIPYAESIKNPNFHGIERWSFEVEMGGLASVEFAIVYEPTGKPSYYDNNFGRNYLVSIDSPISNSGYLPFVRF